MRAACTHLAGRGPLGVENRPDCESIAVCSGAPQVAMPTGNASETVVAIKM